MNESKGTERLTTILALGYLIKELENSLSGYKKRWEALRYASRAPSNASLVWKFPSKEYVHWYQHNQEAIGARAFISNVL